MRNVETLLGYDANQCILLINTTIKIQLYAVNIVLQKQNSATQFLVRLLPHLHPIDKIVTLGIWVKNPPLDAAAALGASKWSSKSSARNDKAGCELLRQIDAQMRPNVCLWGGRDERQSHQRLNSSSKREGSGAVSHTVVQLCPWKDTFSETMCDRKLKLQLIRK